MTHCEKADEREYEPLEALISKLEADTGIESDDGKDGVVHRHLPF